MGKFGRTLAGSVIPAAVLMAVLETPAAGDTTQETENAIRSALEEWRDAFNSRDESRVCDLFAPDLVANFQGQPERNYSSLCQLLQSALLDRARTYRYSLQIKEILDYGETAIVTLVWILESKKTGAPNEIVEEPAIDIFRRQADGSWKISRYLAYPASP